MRPRTRIPLAILGLTLLATTLPALAHPPADDARGEGFDHGPRAAWMAERLELSDAQRAQLDELMSERRADRDQSWRAVAEARRALAEQIHAEAFDETAIRAAAAALAAVEADLAVARARHAQEMRAILTPEQLEELAELRDEHYRPRGHRGRHRPGRFGRRGPAQQ